MRIKYQWVECDLPFLKGVYIKKKIGYLKLRRFLRWAKRIAMYSRQLKIVAICILLYLIIISIIGYKSKVYTSIFDAVWESKDTIFTTLIISFFINVTSNEKKRHDILAEQHEIYATIMYEAEKYIKCLCRIFEGELPKYNSIFYTKERFDRFMKVIDNYEDNINKGIFNRNYKKSDNIYNYNDRIYNYLDMESYVQEVSKNFCDVLKEYKTKVNPLSIQDYKKLYCTQNINFCIMIICNECIILRNLKEKDKEYDLKLVEFTKKISNAIYPLLSNLRMPWRWDLKQNQEIRKVMKEYGTNFSGSKYYFNHFLDSNIYF